MCGVLLLAGPAAGPRLSDCLHRLEHRGPDDLALTHQAGFSLGFTRLAINAPTLAGRQPYTSDGYVCAVNGEIFNAPVLRQQYGLDISSSSDCHVIAPLFARLGTRLLDALDGFYAGVIADAQSGTVYTIRDYIGKKPLFLGRSGTEVFITSELMALDYVDEFTELPSGLCEIDLTGARYRLLATQRNPLPGDHLPTHSAGTMSAELRSLIAAAVVKRLPQGLPVGVFLSGGLDSSIIAAIVARHRPDARYYCLASPDSPDYQFIQQLIELLGLTHVRFISIPTDEALAPLIDKVVAVTLSYNPSVISNGLCTLLLTRAAHEDGLKVVLTGEGADELFGGYHYFKPSENWRTVRQQLVNDLRYTELRRVDLTSMDNAIEVRCPFLDRAVFEYAMQLSYVDLYEVTSEGQRFNKLALRNAFAEDIPASILWRAKTSFDVGSGVRGGVVSHLRQKDESERQALKAIWKRHFDQIFRWEESAEHPYFHAYPVFDDVIDRRGASHK